MLYIDDLMQKRRNSIANTLDLRLICTNSMRPSDAYVCQQTNQY